MNTPHLRSRSRSTVTSSDNSAACTRKKKHKENDVLTLYYGERRDAAASVYLVKMTRRFRQEHRRCREILLRVDAAETSSNTGNGE